MGRCITLLICVICLSSTGCGGFAEFRRSRADLHRANRANTNQIDSAWKQGYGFNNPNIQRRRQGLDPVNFDGTTDRQRSKQSNYLGELLGDLTLYGIKSIFTAVSNTFQR